MPSSTSSFSRAPWGVVWALALLALAELLVRHYYDPVHVDPKLFAANYPDHRYAFDRARPRCWPGDGKITCYGDEYQPIPRQKLRDPKPEGTLRIIVVGASPSYGRRAYPRKIEAPLEQQLGRDVEVLNLSVRGHGTTRMLEQLDEALTLSPDLLVIHPHGSNEYEDDRDAAYVEQLHAGVVGLVRRSEYATVLQKLAASEVYTRAEDIADLRGPSTPETDETERSAGKDPDTLARWQRTVATNTERMLALAEAVDVEVVLVGRGERPSRRPSSWVAFMDELLRELAAQRPGVVYLDTMAALEAAEGEPGELFVDTTHFNKRGHEQLAAALVETIAAAISR